MTAFETIQKHYRQRDAAALDWKKNGGKVVGYFCDNVPEELIMAAGFLPLRISGDPWEGTEVAEGYRMPYPVVTFVETMMNKLLTGKYDFLDYLVIPHARDQIWRLWTQFHFVAELDPQIRMIWLGVRPWVKTAFLQYFEEQYGVAGFQCGPCPQLWARYLEKQGIPVCELPGNNVDARQWDDVKIRQLMTDFIEQRVLPNKQKAKASRKK